MKMIINCFLGLVVLMIAIFGLINFFSTRDTSFKKLLKIASLESQNKMILQSGFKYSRKGFLKEREKKYELINLGFRRLEYRTDDNKLFNDIYTQLENEVIFDNKEFYTDLNNQTKTYSSGLVYRESSIKIKNELKILIEASNDKTENVIIFIRIN